MTKSNKDTLLDTLYDLKPDEMDEETFRDFVTSKIASLNENGELEALIEGSGNEGKEGAKEMLYKLIKLSKNRTIN